MDELSNCGTAGPTGLGGPVDQSRPAEPRLRIWPVFVAFIAALLLTFALQTMVGFGLGFVAGFRSALSGQPVDPEEVSRLLDSPAGFLLTCFLSQASFALVVLVAAVELRGQARAELGLVGTPLTWSRYAALALGSLAVAVLGTIPSGIIDDYLGSSLDMAKMRSELGWVSGPLFMLLVGLVPGLVEEVFFRGYMQRRLLRRWPPLAAILVTSLLFAVVHFDPSWMAFAFPMGVWLGVIAWRTGSIWPCIICHAAANTTTTLLGLPMDKGGVPEWAAAVSLLLFAGAGIVGLVAGLVTLVRRPAPVARPPGLDLTAATAENAPEIAADSVNPGV